eukprot:s2064_g8.t1
MGCVAPGETREESMLPNGWAAVRYGWGHLKRDHEPRDGEEEDSWPASGHAEAEESEEEHGEAPLWTYVCPCGAFGPKADNYWHRIAHCECRDENLFPTEYSRNYHMDNAKATLPMRSSIAVLMAGQTRSFSTALIREYWRLVFSNLKHHAAEVMLFAVLSRVSTNSKEFEGVSTFSLEQMDLFLKDLNVTWQAEFPLDCTWKEAAAVVTDPALHFLLSPPFHLRHTGKVGFMNAYRARAVAFDLMLRFETANQMRFNQVLFVRPDIIYDLIPNVPNAIARCPDAAYVFNDIFGGMERNLAPWYATHVATARSWTGTAATMTPQSTSQEIQKILGWNFSIGQPPFMPAMHLAIHGVPFWGRALEVYSGEVRCDPSDGLVANMWIIRDQTPNASGARTACLRVGRQTPKIDDVRRFLNRLGINASLANMLVGLCQKS